MESKAIPKSVERRADSYFGLRVLAAYCRHVAAALLGGMNIGHELVRRLAASMKFSMLNGATTPLDG
jgi:hypothetical protein